MPSTHCLARTGPDVRDRGTRRFGTGGVGSRGAHTEQTVLGQPLRTVGTPLGPSLRPRGLVHQLIEADEDFPRDAAGACGECAASGVADPRRCGVRRSRAVTRWPHRVISGLEEEGGHMAKDVRVAGRRRTSIRAACTALAGYPLGTLRTYDHRALHPAVRWRGFSNADITATRVIERRALRDSVARGVLAARLPWKGTPDRHIDISELRPDSDAYESLCHFWDVLIAVDGVGPAIASKLKYLKWPRATIIQDSLVRSEYDAYALEVGADVRNGPGRWRRRPSNAVGRASTRSPSSGTSRTTGNAGSSTRSARN